MKKLILLSALLSMGLSFQEARCQSQAVAPEATVGVIDIHGLKKLQASKKPFALVDARQDQYFDGKVIPGARRLPDNATDAMIKKTLPDKNQLVVAYCGGVAVGCPASGTLAKRLVAAGYKDVLDYHGGTHEWVSSGNEMQELP